MRCTPFRSAYKGLLHSRVFPGLLDHSPSIALTGTVEHAKSFRQSGTGGLHREESARVFQPPTISGTKVLPAILVPHAGLVAEFLSVWEDKVAEKEKHIVIGKIVTGQCILSQQTAIITPIR